MTQTYTNNTFEFIKQLTSCDFLPAQAEAIIKVCLELRQQDYELLASKSDFQQEMINLKNSLERLELRMTIKLGAMLVGVISIIKMIL